MIGRIRRVAMTLAALLAPWHAATTAAQTPGDPWAADIARFEEADRATPPPRGQIVFVGSSSIRLWDTQTAFPDLQIINRGFGGSDLSDAVRYADRIVLPYQPRLVVVYAGDNDIAGGKLSEQVVVDAERFVSRVRAQLPETRIIFIGIKPSPLRWMQVDRMRTTNAMLRQLAERDDRVAFMDVDGPMMGWDERPRRELFLADGLHLSAEGYRLWTTLLRPLLVAPPPGAPTATAGR